MDISFFSDDDDAPRLERVGFHRDLAHPCFDEAERCNQAGLIHPIDLKRTKDREKIFAVFRKLLGLVRGDKA
ncbi:MAG: hypothetical protein ACT4NU_09210 [Chromatiales bacterium]